MIRIKLEVAYDGTAYHGWQVQKNGDTIEAQLNKHLSALLGEDIRVIGASRTDSGVHALCNIAVFDTDTKIPAEKISYALNRSLPEDIRVQDSCRVADDFHPRKCSSMKTYEYKIWNGKFPLPTQRLYSHFLYVPLDVDNMREAAAYLEGEHDFKSFCSSGSGEENTVRTIYSAEIEKEGQMLKIRLCGSGFLYNMVRIIAGTLAEVGKGSLPADKIPEILNARDRAAAGPTLPARGLTLIRYDFVDESAKKPV